MNLRVHPEGHRYIGICAAVTVLLFIFSNVLGWLALLATLLSVWLFRDPDRFSPVRGGLVLAPADGKVQMITRAVPPVELDAGQDAVIRISIVMSLNDAHVNRVPVSGSVVHTAYRPGRFLNPGLDKAAEENERASMTIEDAEGRQFHVVQIAGYLGRSLVTKLVAGDDVDAGTRFGTISFGSRVDLYLPEGVEPMVAQGQQCIAGETVLVDVTNTETRREAEVR